MIPPTPSKLVPLALIAFGIVAAIIASVALDGAMARATDARLAAYYQAEHVQVAEHPALPSRVNGSGWGVPPHLPGG